MSEEKKNSKFLAYDSSGFICYISNITNVVYDGITNMQKGECK